MKEIQNKFRSDTGAGVLRAYQYQAACAALFSLQLLEATPEYQAIFCEYHDDFSLQRSDNKYIVFQIKTRDKNRPAFKTGDTEIKKTLRIFCDLEHNDGAVFVRYVIGSNHGFWNQETDWKNISHVCEISRQKPEPADCKSVISKVFSEIFKNRDCSFERGVLRDALRKTYVINNLLVPRRPSPCAASTNAIAHPRNKHSQGDHQLPSLSPRPKALSLSNGGEGWGEGLFGTRRPHAPQLLA